MRPRLRRRRLGRRPRPRAEADDEAVAETDEEPEVEAADEPEAEAPAKPRRRRRRAAAEPEAEAATEKPAKPDKPARPLRGGGARRVSRERRLRSCALRPSTCAPPLARRGWYATTSAGSRSRRRELSWLFTPRAIAQDWSKLLESAVANAEHNHELVGEDLYVKAVHADEGPTIKRFRPRAMGRATRIRKRTSHLTILLTPKDSVLPNEIEHGSKSSSRVDPRGLHPRLEVELVQRAQFRRLPARGHADPRAHRRPAVPRRAVGHHDSQERHRG